MNRYWEKDHIYPDREWATADVSEKRCIDTKSIGIWGKEFPKLDLYRIHRNYRYFLDDLGYPINTDKDFPAWLNAAKKIKRTLVSVIKKAVNF